MIDLRVALATCVFMLANAPADADQLYDSMNNRTVREYRQLEVQKIEPSSVFGNDAQNVLLVDYVVLHNGSQYCLPNGILEGNVLDIYKRLEPIFETSIRHVNDDEKVGPVFRAYLAKHYPCGAMINAH